MTSDYLDEALKTATAIAENTRKKKFCPKCKYYQEYENPGKGTAKGFCTSKRDELLEQGMFSGFRIHWADCSLKGTCPKFEDK